MEMLDFLVAHIHVFIYELYIYLERANTLVWMELATGARIQKKNSDYDS